MLWFKKPLFLRHWRSGTGVVKVALPEKVFYRLCFYARWKQMSIATLQMAALKFARKPLLFNGLVFVGLQYDLHTETIDLRCGNLVEAATRITGSEHRLAAITDERA